MTSTMSLNQRSPGRCGRSSGSSRAAMTLYWGSPKPGRSLGSKPLVVEDDKTSITISKNVDHIEPRQSMFSYHESGQGHVKLTGITDGEVGQITRPGDLLAARGTK
jgi:hypothetical protein